MHLKIIHWWISTPNVPTQSLAWETGCLRSRLLESTQMWDVQVDHDQCFKAQHIKSDYCIAATHISDLLVTILETCWTGNEFDCT